VKVPTGGDVAMRKQARERLSPREGQLTRLESGADGYSPDGRECMPAGACRLDSPRTTRNPITP
jgi:hypothetical protein